MVPHGTNAVGAVAEAAVVIVVVVEDVVFLLYIEETLLTLEKISNIILSNIYL